MYSIFLHRQPPFTKNFPLVPRRLHVGFPAAPRLIPREPSPLGLHRCLQFPRDLPSGPRGPDDCRCLRCGRLLHLISQRRRHPIGGSQRTPVSSGLVDAHAHADTDADTDADADTHPDTHADISTERPAPAQSGRTVTRSRRETR